MQVHNLTQGSPEWHAYRREHFNASDAPAMLSCSPYKTREQLIAELATGITPDVDAATQRVFDAGHRYEALARPLAEKIISEELAPLVGSNGKYSASFDGVTLMGDTGWEHKSLNAELRAAMVDGCTGADLPKVFRVQMEQQCMVEVSLTRVLFTASKWDGDELVEARHCWYTPDAALRAEIVAGWAQLEKEVAAFVVPEAAPVKVVAEAVTALPTVFAQVSGSIALKDNLPEYEVALRDFIDNRLISKPETDQDFANLDLQIKALKGAEAALDASEEQALSQAEMLSAFKRQKDMLHKLTRDTRLAAEKLLTAEKERIKVEHVQRGQKEFAAHMASLNTRLGKPYMPTVPADFAGAIKGKRTVDSLRSAVNDELARAKIAANEIADRIQLNLTSLRELATEHAFLFADAPQLVMKANDDLLVLIKSRIAEHEAKEAARVAADKEKLRVQAEAQATAKVAENNRMLMSEISGIQQQVAIAQLGRAGVRKGGTLECIRETLAETEAWVIDAEHFGAMAGLAQSAKETAAAQIKSLLDAATAREQAVHTGASAQAEIAEASAAGQLAAPLADDLSTLAREKSQEAVAGIDAAQVINTAQRAAAVAPTVDTESATLLIGAINSQLGYIVNAAFLAELGFHPVRIDGARRFYRDSDLPLIGRAIAQHTLRVTQLQPA